MTKRLTIEIRNDPHPSHGAKLVGFFFHLLEPQTARA